MPKTEYRVTILNRGRLPTLVQYLVSMIVLSQLRRVLILGVISFATALSIVSGQKVQYSVEHFGVEEGLPAHWVTSMIIHSSDYIYVGTIGGLTRFDGYTFMPVVAKGEYADVLRGTINSMGEAANGDIVMSISEPSRREPTADVFILDLDEMTLTRSDEESLANAANHSVYGTEFAQVAENTGDTVVFADRFGNTFSHTFDERRKPATAVLDLFNGYRIDLSDTWSTLPASPFVRSRNLGDVMYWPTYNGLYKVSVRISPFDRLIRKETESVAYGTVCRSIAEIDSANLIVSVESEGLWIVEKETGDITNTAYLDKTMPNPAVRSNYARRLDKVGPGHLNGITHSQLYSVSLFEKAAIQRCNFPGTILASTLMDSGRYVMSTAGWQQDTTELWLVDTNTWVPEKLILSNQSVHFKRIRPTYLTTSENGKVWCATKSGLYLLDIQNNEILHLYTNDGSDVEDVPYPVSRVLSGPHIWAIHVDADGKVWLGLDSDGLNILDPESGNVLSYTMQDGLSNNTIVSMLPDSTGMWLGTFNGLSHFDTARAQFLNFYVENGLSHNEFNRFSQYIGSGGKYYMGTMNGITSFYPEEVLGDRAELKLLISEVAHFDRKSNSMVSYQVSEDRPETISVPSNNRLLTLRFTLNDQNNPAKNKSY